VGQDGVLSHEFSSFQGIVVEREEYRSARQDSCAILLKVVAGLLRLSFSIAPNGSANDLDRLQTACEPVQ
jgi:hypothetical protein